MRHASLLSILALVACQIEPSRPLSPPAPSTSPPPVVEDAGPRLRGQYVAAVEGQARRLLQVVDTRTGQPCRIGPGTESATVSCTPIASAMIVHLDARCETEALLETSEETATWVTAWDNVTGNRVARVGAQVSDGVETRFIGGGGGQCYPYGAGKGPALHRMGEGLDALVTGPIESVEVSERIAAITFFGDDGSEFQLDLVDRTSGARCTPGDTEAGPRCRPDLGEAAHEGLLDASCERRAIIEYSLDRVVQLRDPSGADEGVFRFAPGGRGDDNSVTVGRRAGDGSCQTERAQLGRKTYYVGAPYPAAEWPEVVLDIMGGGRLASIVVSPPGGGVLEPLAHDREALFDDAGTRCGPVWVDGSLRCLPAAPAGFVWSPAFFADSECTVHAVAYHSGDETPTVFTIYEGGERESLPEGRVLEVRELMCTAGYTKIGGECRRNDARSTFMVLGSEVPAARFAGLELTTASE